MNDITLQSIPFLRMVNNDYLADAFFYLSKERGQSIINHVTREFNEAYARFLKEYPLFDGKVAILAYSLGGIITWDILANNYGVTPKNEINSKLDFLFPTLNFKPDFFFTLGSPLSAFLTVRNQDPKVYRPDASILFENIFHPFDPLAYRFEPMLNSYYKNKPAVLIDAYRDAATFFSDDHILQRVYNKGLKWMTCISKIFVSQQEASYSEDELSTPKLSLDYYSDEEEDEEIKTPCDLLVSNENLFISQKRRSIDVEWQEEMMMNKRQKKMNDTEKLLLSTTMTRNATMIAAEEFNVLENRVDYVLRPERCLLGLVNKNGYLSGLTAHFSYWTHPDLMWHIVRRLEYGKRK
ncbi:DDHD domain-containing protein [Cokeromyces recurvatus]|uniref:DDHD domain-containing protein n=1 Tax=Cokeromyces recurvatus TaxID=90255 RepID=UPI00221E53BF|nr:DDHD domain-containing protein [Cokeromyces recurvatus]KAI7905343.1 DDHD domain-containing protein [Cokeromyces recurvatus]